MKELKEYIIEEIETNKAKYDIDYESTIKKIEQLLEEIKDEYTKLHLWESE